MLFTEIYPWALSQCLQKHVEAFSRGFTPHRLSSQGRIALPTFPPYPYFSCRGASPIPCPCPRPPPPSPTLSLSRISKL